MKNDLHMAFKTILNHPIHISIPDSLRAHLDDKIRLISMLPSQWPKVRAREIFAAKKTLLDTIDGHKIEKLNVNDFDAILVDDKYFFTDDLINNNSSIELMFLSFKENDVTPYIRREWSKDFFSIIPDHTKLIDKNHPDTKFFNNEYHYKVVGLEKSNIDCMADLLAYSYMFEWDNVNKLWVYNDDPHFITKRLRTPWYRYLVQYIYNEPEILTYDLAMLAIHELYTKTGNDEYCINDADVLTVKENLKKIKKLNDLYNDTHTIKTSTDVMDDPLFNWDELI